MAASFTGGKKLEAKLAEIAARVASANTVRVGFLEGATYPDGQTVAAVAAFNNYGTSKAPPRPFFTQMIAANKNGWGAKLARILKANNYDAAKSLGLMGYGIKGQLQSAIIAFDNPPDSPETLARKKSKHGAKATLVDTGHMLNSVDFDVS